MRTSKKYTRELRQQFGYLATWLPGVPLALGDIGILKRNTFTKISNLSNFDIDFKIEKDPTKSDLEYTSKGAVSITTKASGTVAPQGSVLGEVDAGITVEFSKDKAILFKANGTSSPIIEDQILLGRKILSLYKKGQWDKDWVVITELVQADSASILISSSSTGKIELKATGELKTANMDIADADLGLELSFSRDLSTKIIAENSLTPLFRAMQVKGRLLGPPYFAQKAIRSIDLITPSKAKSDGSLIYFGKADYEDFDED